MEYRTLSSDADIAAAGVLAAAGHQTLREHLPVLPRRTDRDFAPRIARAVEHGVVVGEYARGRLVAFLGAFRVDDFRNLGPGSYGPDWCHGSADALDHGATIQRLYRELAPRLLAEDVRIHSFGFYATEPDALEAMYATGFGQIVIDAAVATAQLPRSFTDTPRRAGVRRAEPRDAAELARLNDELAGHIGASPVFFPDSRGMVEDAWAAWLAEDSHIALIAERNGHALGYIKSQEPQSDVSYAVHDESTLAINGMYVDPAERRHRVGAELLAELARIAPGEQKHMLSVDFETANIEAQGFWLRWFEPVTYSVERRL